MNMVFYTPVFHLSCFMSVGGWVVVCCVVLFCRVLSCGVLCGDTVRERVRLMSSRGRSDGVRVGFSCDQESGLCM